MLHWLSYDHQGGGLGGCINVFDEYFLYVTEHVAVVNMLHWLSCDYQGGGGGCINVRDEYFPSVTEHVAAFDHRTIVAGTQQMDGTWKHFKTWRPMSMLHKKNQQVYQKKIHLGLQLDMAS